MARKIYYLTIATVAILITCPCLLSIDANATDNSTIQQCTTDGISIEEMRNSLAAAGVDTSSMSDQEIEVQWGWWANKNLIGKYMWNDPTGVNWLLNKAGVEGTIDDIILVGNGVSIVVSGATYVITGALLSAGIVGWFVAAGVFVYSAYSSIMQDNAIEKANLAIELISQQKNYAVYETTVMWNTVPNGYEVEEW